MNREEAKDYIREWCPYDRQEEIIKALEQAHCEDVISRQAVLEAVDFYDGFNQQHFTIKNLREDIEQLPSVNPQPKIGKWQQDLDGKYLCSECGIGFKEQPTLMGKPMFLWCPLCGAKMQEVGE